METPNAMDDNFDELFIIETEDCDVYKMSEGILLYIGRVDQFMSMGFIEVNVGLETDRRSRPAPGLLKQVEGSAKITIYENNKITEEKILKIGDSIDIDANREYSIKNISKENSLTFWKFRGDLSNFFEELKKKLEKVNVAARPKSGYKDLYKQHVEARKSCFDKFKK